MEETENADAARRALVEVGFAFGMHFAQAASDRLSGVDLVVHGAHPKGLVDELGNEFLPGVSQFLYRPMVSFSVNCLDVLGVPAIMLAEPRHHRRFRRSFSEMRRVLAGDIGTVDSEADLAGGDEGDRRLRVAGKVEAVGSVCVGSHIEAVSPSR